MPRPCWPSLLLRLPLPTPPRMLTIMSQGAACCLRTLQFRSSCAPRALDIQGHLSCPALLPGTEAVGGAGGARAPLPACAPLERRGKEGE
jgi:hypothetical protein